MQENSFMKEAIDLALANVISGKGGPFGAVVVKDGKIIGRGVNLVTSNNDPTAHAEVNAIRDACKNLQSFQLTGCDIYTTCEPCPMCLGAIYWARPANIFYACSKNDASSVQFDDSFIYKELDTPVEKRKIPTAQIMREQAISIFEAWTAQKNKIIY